jgi:hypothetical protein
VLISKAQKEAVYDPKEEIVYDGKRYRVHNNWLSAGGGWAINTHRNIDQKSIGVDYNFHIKTRYFQLGVFTTGNDFTPGNNYNFHFGIGYRKEKPKYNFAAFAGPSASYFYRPLEDSLRYDVSKLYNQVGVYTCVQIVYKIKYDIGVGLDLFADYNQVQTVFGARVVLFFSGSFRGDKGGHYMDGHRN